MAGTTASFTTADETKLDGIEAGATADQTASEILTALLTVDGAASNLDADLLDGQQGLYYLDYTNFTNTPTIPSSTTDITEGTNLYYTDERVDDRVNALLVAGSNITLTYDDGANTLTIAASGGGGGDVSKVGTPANNQIGVWTGDGTIEGDADLTWDGSDLTVTGGMTLTDTNPVFTIIDSNQPADERRIDISGSSGNLTFFAMSDAGLPIETLATLNRGNTLISANSIVTRELGDERYQRTITVGTTAPGSPSVGDLWVDTN